MQLISLETENFKKLGTASFSFTGGLNAVVGDNAQGKSTLLRAVALSLYGASVLPGKAEDIATWGTDSWGVTLKFSSKGKEYTVTRRKTTARVHVDGELEASGNSACTKYITELLGLDAKDYNLLVHSRQGETAYVLTYGATALQRKVEEFSGIEELDAITTEARRRGRTLSEKVKILQDKLASGESIEELRAECERISSEIYTLDERVATIEGKLISSADKPETTVAQLHRKNIDYQVYLSELSHYQERKEDLESQLKSLGSPLDLSEAESRVSTLTTEIKRGEAHNRALSDLKAVIAVALPEEPGEEEEDTDDIQDKVNTLGQKVASLTSDLASIRKQIRDGVCPTCKTKLNKDLAKLNEDQLNTEQELQTTQNEYNAWSSKLQENVKLSKQWAVYADAVERRETAEAKLSELGEEVNTTELVDERSGLLQQVEGNQKLLKEREGIEGRLKRLKEPEEKSPVSEETITSTEQLWEDYRNTEALLEQADGLKAQRGSLAKLKERVQRDMENIYSLIAQITALSSEADTAIGLSNYLKGQREYYLQRVWDSILGVASNFLAEASRGTLTKLVIEDGRFLYEEDGKLIPSAEASGAQLAFIGTALRLGLNKALYRGNTFLAFDEPTEAMTEENSRQLVSSLVGTAEQVLVITHKDTDQGLAANLLEI